MLRPSRPLRSPAAIVLLAVLALLSAPLARAAELTVLAAASLTDALQAAAPAFTEATGHTLRLGFGGSGTLARQLTEGARADLFVSADSLRMDALARADLLLPGTRRDLLANTLVLVVAAVDGAPAPADLAALRRPALRRIALGDPATVPAGTYASELLERHALREPLAPKLVAVDSVRAALAAVEAGHADAAFVYRTDALASTRVRIALEFPPPAGPAIRYPAAVVRDTRHPEAARALLEWLATAPAAREIFARHGFLRPPSASETP
jgi:molybdate transport system substrate-binding protein